MICLYFIIKVFVYVKFSMLKMRRNNTTGENNNYSKNF